MKILITLLLISSTGYATLGEYRDSLNQDRQSLKVQNQISNKKIMPLFEIENISTGGSQIQEYINSQGMVFAITWHGPSQPDLKSLLGSYYDSYKATQKQMPKLHGRRMAIVKNNDIIVEHWGHMRDLHGRAYLPSLLPLGVTSHDLQ